jgi:pantothenate kinase type III
MKKIIPVLILCFFSSCSSIIVSSQYDRGSRIDQYMSFNWLPGVFEGNESATMDRPVLRVIQSQVLREMIFKGFSFEQESPEVLVNVEAITKEKPDLANTRKSGFTYWSNYDSTRVFRPGDLVVELIDAGSATVIWQATAQNALSGNLGKEEVAGRLLKEIFGTLGY